MRAGRLLRVALVVPLGTVASHAAGYELAAGGGGHGSAGHDHLPLLVAVSVPLALAGVLAAAWAGYRGRRTGPRLATIATVQATAFLLLEVLEQLAAGAGAAAVASRPAVWWGLAAQVAVAWAVLALVRAGTALGASLQPRPGPPDHPVERVPGPRPWLGSTRPAPSPTSRRGPPLPAAR